MIAVLPLFLYPLLGMSFLQVTQFISEHPIRVLVVGAPADPRLPPLVEKDRFAADLFSDREAIELLQVVSQPDFGDNDSSPEPVQQGELVVVRTSDPTRELNELTREALESERELEELEVRRPTLEDVYLELVDEESW